MSGYSKIPVFNVIKPDIIGYIKAKQLIKM